MITIQTHVPVTVGTSSGTVSLTNGVWTVLDVTTLAGTNVTVRSGGVVLVDAAGAIHLTDGPDLAGASVGGFGLGIGTVGVMLGILWVWRRMFGRVAQTVNFD